MSMLDSFFNKGFKGTKCKTMLKLTIPRIKLLRNRREHQIKQMRKDIAKLLETGQEATARIRIEHIIREENMMAAQEIVELFCELIAVRLPIIESQRECPLDLKEAIASICFAAPRCADLPELLQVQMAFVSKYGKEFVAAATELMPDCGVNRQLVELLSVRAPSPEKKLKLLKEIAEEHELEWDPAPSETELFKSHEDLLNGPAQFVTGSKVPLPKEKHEDILQSTSAQGANEHSDTEDEFDELEFPEVPKVLVRPVADSEVTPPQPSAPHPESCLASGTHFETEAKSYDQFDSVDSSQDAQHDLPRYSVNPGESKQFLPFISPPSISPPSLPSASLPVRESIHSQYLSRTKSDATVNLNDVIAAARAAAESAERAAAAARSAASLAEVRMCELSKSKSGVSSDDDSENPFHASNHGLSAATEKLQLGNNALDAKNVSDRWSPAEPFENNQNANGSKYGETDLQSSPGEHSVKTEFPYHQPQRIPSLDDDPYSSYPNLFNSQSGNIISNSLSPDNSEPRRGS